MADWNDIQFLAGQFDYINRLNALRTRAQNTLTELELARGSFGTLLDHILAHATPAEVSTLIASMAVLSSGLTQNFNAAGFRIVSAGPAAAARPRHARLGSCQSDGRRRSRWRRHHRAQHRSPRRRPGGDPFRLCRRRSGDRCRLHACHCRSHGRRYHHRRASRCLCVRRQREHLDPAADHPVRRADTEPYGDRRCSRCKALAHACRSRRS